MPAHNGLKRPRIAVVGVHGHGAWHVERVAALAAADQVVFAGVADPRPPEPGRLAPDVPAYGDLEALLAEVDVDVVVICTPIHTHARLAEAALRAGVDILLEKPPVASLAEFEHLERVVAETGQLCQVGFQSLGAEAARVLAAMVANGCLGEIRGVAGVGMWVRTRAYWERAPWAGRRRLDGMAVVDGAVTNPFAHAVATALLLAGAVDSDAVKSVEAELFRANPIEADDTSVVRVVTATGTPVVLGLTLCAEQSLDPRLIVYGSAGRAELYYTRDVLEITIDETTTRTTHGRTDLLANLLEHRADPSIALLADLSSTGAFTRVLEAVRLSPDPRPIGAEHVRWTTDPARPDDDRPVVVDVEHWIERAANELATFSELGAPWTKAGASC